MKITMKIEPAYDNEIRFYDACHAAAAVLQGLAEKALRDGDIESCIGEYPVVEDNDDAETVGKITVR